MKQLIVVLLLALCRGIVLGQSQVEHITVETKARVVFYDDKGKVLGTYDLDKKKFKGNKHQCIALLLFEIGRRNDAIAKLTKENVALKAKLAKLQPKKKVKKSKPKAKAKSKKPEVTK